jgi:hypothetical protein
MKKIFILLITGATLYIFNACAEEDFTDRYLNPAKVTTTSVEQLFTGTLEKANEILRIGYGRFMTHDQYVGKMSQAWTQSTASAYYTNGIYQYSVWDWYIGAVTQYKMLKKEYEASGDESLKAYELCGRAVMYHVMLQALDEFGKLPYSEVGLYIATGEMVFAHLDDTKELYELIIDDLGVINTELSGLPNGAGVATGTDWLNDGNMDKWRRYVNSLRLRAAVRVSGAGGNGVGGSDNPENTLKSKGETVIKEILGNAGQYPVVTGTDDQVFVTWHGSGNGWWNTITGFDDYNQWSMRNLASHPRIQRMDLNGDGFYTPEADDPRLPLLYDPVHGGTNEGKYVGVNTRDASGDITENLSGAHDNGIRQYSYVNERSFRDNRKMDAYVITPSEIAFYKAEAALRFGVGSGNERDEFVRGVFESVKMYMKINAQSDAAEPSASRSPVVDMSYWTDAKINEFAGKLWENAQDKYKLIYEQLWLHCGIFNSVECWNTLRRTGYPNDLYFPVSSDGTLSILPQRFIIPTDEVQRNKNMPDESTRGAYTPGESWWEVIFWARNIQGEIQ